MARYGGEEFSILMRGCEARAVERVVRRLRARIARLAIRHGDRDDHIAVITVSIGVAVRTPGSNTGPAELLAQADAALYDAKRRGRNCHVVRTVGEASVPEERRPGRLAALRRRSARAPQAQALKGATLKAETNAALAR